MSRTNLMMVEYDKMVNMEMVMIKNLFFFFDQKVDINGKVLTISSSYLSHELSENIILSEDFLGTFILKNISRPWHGLLKIS